MGGLDPAFFAAGGGTSLALAAVLWALSQRRESGEAMAQVELEAARQKSRAEAAEAAADAFDNILLAIQGSQVRVAGGAHGMVSCLALLGLPVGAEPQAVIEALRRDQNHAERLTALFERGEACDFEVAGEAEPGVRRTLTVEGRVSGAVAWLRLTQSAATGLPSAARFAAFLDGLSHPAWITSPGGKLVWANRSWLVAAEAGGVEEAVARGAVFDRAAEQMALEAAKAGEPRTGVRFVSVGGKRQAMQITALPLEGGGAAAMAFDASDAEEAREQLKRHTDAHDQTLNRLADAVAIFGPDRRLSFHNTAFAELWGLEPAWLADKPTHGEVLDRLRQRRRLPETADYAGWKAKEFAHYEALNGSPDELWSLPDGRTLRVARQPHPLGGLLILYADITGELRLRAQYNAQVQVQQATLDKLNDAVAVYGADGRLRLHNEAFERFWSLSPAEMVEAADLDRLAELCLPLVHDRTFWRELKARVGDPDPQVRAAISGEIRTSDRRFVAYQTRPLPDGATLIAFSDITATRELEQAVEERSAALAEAQRLKRDFVGNVSYELRTPLTTIIGYAELLESLPNLDPDRRRAHLGSVRTAAEHLARSIDDVLDMAQIDAGEMALSLGDVDLTALLDEVVTRASRTAADLGVDLAVGEVVDHGGAVRADQRRLMQVLDHLVDTALHNTPQGGAVRINAHREGAEIKLSVSDTGRGFPYHVQAHIFDRFVGREGGGAGLGMALVKALVELHGGWVALESIPGEGATFTCHLPEDAQIASAHPELSFS